MCVNTTRSPYLTLYDKKDPKIETKKEQNTIKNIENINDKLSIMINCPFGNVICKNDKGSSCISHYSVCRNSNFETLAESPIYSGYNIENLTLENYCNIHHDTCLMIINYDPPLMDE
ncbi:hypothetical protein H8356DRAFT_1075984 [Neocallimastix lanati (nom. inval.)]|uniref:Uncharacterized protein n=1 Tax=Neocallimastix californiae TaxID=1754190 RepID=A0A1Y2D5G1_9FUNG|nr:hypothetical protein H8356DRAFT_1075984 [Neocallimastix sp. JGI-2020a]ORY54447.1 hypothetical protein LY90DRAFT_507637 [Neocallimastix californiae]|eukprot:ORY54447.1 hypothetical protein LY90DRAFT_507637 [Neocallimastix californiae]